MKTKLRLMSVTKQSFLSIVAIAIFSLFSLSITFQTSPVFADQKDQKLTCKEVTVPVKLAATDDTNYQVSGTLCSRGSLSGKTLQVLIHGITYDRTYWNFPSVNGKNYSYVSRSTAAGYATLSIDRIGIGKSSHPADANSVTVQSNAYVVHQLVQNLRNGKIANTPFSKIILAGHSYGSGVAIYESATYKDVDGLILSGLLHDVSIEGANAITNSLYPAQLDPKFADLNLPEGYLTTIPGTRGAAFYNTATADPDVIALDEKGKQTVTGGELNTLLDATALYDQIKVPIFLAVGQKDLLFCNDTSAFQCTDSATVLQREKGYFSQAKSVQAYVLANSGHDVNLDINAHLWFEKANEWANSQIGK